VFDQWMVFYFVNNIAFIKYTFRAAVSAAILAFW